MLDFFRKFTAWLLEVVNAIFKQNIDRETFLNIIMIVAVIGVMILLLSYLNLKKKHKKLKRDIRRNNIQVVKQYKHGKYRDVIRTKTELRNPKKLKKLGSPKESSNPAKNVTNIVED